MSKIINLFTDGKVKNGEREFTRLVGGFDDKESTLSDLQIAELLGYKKGAREVRERISENKNYFIEGVHFVNIKKYIGDNRDKIIEELKLLGYSRQSIDLSENIYLFSQEGLTIYLQIADIHNDYSSFISEYFRTDNLNIKVIRHEMNFKNLLLNMLNDYIEVKTQFPIGKYRVDFFIPSLELIIEYDEDYHKYRQEEDKIRENDIIDEFLKWEKIFLEHDDYLNLLNNRNEVINIIRVKKGEEDIGIKKIMNVIANCGFNVFRKGTNRIFDNITDLYDYYNIHYCFDYVKDKIEAIGYKIKETV